MDAPHLPNPPMACYLSRKYGPGLRPWPPPPVISRRIWGGAVNQHSLGHRQPSSPPGVPSGRGIRPPPPRILLHLRAMTTGRCSLDRSFVLDLPTVAPQQMMNYNSQGPTRRGPGRAGVCMARGGDRLEKLGRSNRGEGKNGAC